VKRLLLAGAAIALSTPALADHTGPSGVGSGGGSLNVISPETLDEGRTAIGLRLTYTRPKQRSDEQLEALAGEEIDAHNSRYTLNAAIGAAYGVTHELTISAELPYVRRDHLREGEHAHVGGEAINEVSELGSVAGIGDLSLLAKYRMTHGSSPALAVIGGIKVPTGSTHRRDDARERFETEHQPGSGSWDPIIGAAFGTGAGPLRLTARALYQVAGKGAQHTRLGDRLQGGIALSHRFGAEHHHQETDDPHDEAEHHHDSGELEHHGHQSWDAFVDLSAEWEGRQTVAGEVQEDSGGKSIWSSPGARFNSAGGWAAAVALGLPLWQRIRESHPDNDYRLTLSIGRAL
jgi:hypothetical protein